MRFLAPSLLSLALAGCSATASVAAQSQPAAQQPVVTASQPSASDISNIYIAHRGENTTNIARKFLDRTSYMTIAELDQAIRSANHLSGAGVKKDQQLTIPGLEAQPVVEHSRPYPKDEEIHAVYLTGIMAASHNGMAIIKRWHDAGGNAVVFDIKDSDGTINVPFADPLAPHKRPAIGNLPKFVRWLHSMDMHAIARIALFRDEHIATQHPELAVHSRTTGKVWLENGKQVWTDPSNPRVQDYDLALANSVAGSGVDEVQFDYVRFPAEGDQKDAGFLFQSQPAAGGKPLERKDVIANFLARAYAQLHPKGVLLSVDVFGVMAWQRSVDLNHTGQDIVAMAQHCDVVSPMIYPSHFFGMDGYAAPGDAPEHFISTSMDRFRAITASSGVTIRPWLQAFAWRTKTYSPEYIETQVKTSKEHGGIGFLLWNARNDYSKPYAAMPVMLAHKDVYFGKAILPPVQEVKVADSSTHAAAARAGVRSASKTHAPVKKARATKPAAPAPASKPTATATAPASPAS